jgi:hypothetical protein
MADRLLGTIQGIVPNSVRWRPSGLAPNDGSLTGSSYTELDPRPGTAVTADSRARLRPEITQAQAGGTTVLKVTEGGLPGPDGAAVTYRQSKETADSARGWNQGNHISGWTSQEWSDLVIYDDMALVVIPSTQTVVGFSQDNGGPAGLATTRTFDPAKWLWSSSASVPWAPSIGTDAIALVYLPGSDRILAISMPATAGPGSAGIMQIWSSEDSGGVWEEYSLRPVRDPAADRSGSGFGNAIRRARGAAQADGSVLVVVEDGTGTESIAQMASADLGVTFALVEPVPTIGRDLDVLALPDGSYALTFIEKATGFPRIRFLGSAFDPISSAVEISIASSQLNSMTAAVDYDGTIYVFGARDTAFARVEVWFSTDSGRKWTAFDYGVIDTGDNTAFLILKSCVASGGYLIIQHQWSAAVGDEDGSVGTLILAGWTNLTAVDDAFFPVSVGNPATGPRQFERYGFGPKTGVETNSWLPIELPGDTIYTATGSTGTLEAPGRMLMSSVASVDRMQITTTTGIEDVVVMAEFAVISGGSQIASQCGFLIDVSDPGAPKSTLIVIRADTLGFAVHNVHAAADVGVVALDMTIPIQIKLHIFEAVGLTFVRSYYRRPGNTLWVAGPSGDNITTSALASSLSVLQWVHIVSTTTVSHWYQFHWAFGAGEAFGDGKVEGKRIADLPYPLLEVGNGVTGEKAFLSLRSGPGSRGEVYTIQAEADHGVHKLFPSVSPSRDDTFEAESNALTRVSVDLLEDTRIGLSSALVMAVMNSNVRKIELYGTISAVPTLIGEIDLATGFVGLEYILTGDQLAPNTFATIDAARWIQAMEFAGGTVVLPGGKVRTIASNSSGGWSQSSTVVPHFRLEGIDGTEASTGFCDLVAPAGFVVFHMGTTADQYRQFYQVSIPAAQATAEGRYIVGNVLLGGLIVPGKTWSNGWSLEVSGNIRSRRDPYGTEYREQRGPESRVYSIAWPDGVKMQYTREGLDVAYIGSSAVGATALAGRDDVLGQLIGALRESGGFSELALLISKVPDASGVTVTDPTLWVYGHLSGTVRADHVTGNEDDREFYRIGGLTLNEVR